ncbi:hypothetical protein [Phormidium sp. CCY1219]|jgi:hypothetical protein|uniref:hypothetical protein n=1 Tax=Phormidium sp. CCY1219 TaxID=2886104 RepID=UPI002D1F1381|nr:hypothetical protein [Phormidium sp. CCY1219]MEB3826449.1 hypothetical protein [Phormidium sp. CCY1219]
MYAAPQWQEETTVESPTLLDPTVLRAARQIYRTYKEVHPDGMQRPLGVAIDRFTHRGQLIFRKKPALLLTECFVPFDRIESGLY